MSRVLTLLLGLMGGAAASQVPEFVTQYTQRLGGWVDAYEKVVVELDERAGKLKMSRTEYIAALKANAKAEARQEGAHLETQVGYHTALSKAHKSLTEASPAMRGFQLMQNYNPVLVEATWREFRPALPATVEGIGYGAAGFVAGWLLVFLGYLPARIRRARQQAAANQPQLY